MLSDFNVSWFLTTPGLLMTSGVVLLIFALILIIVTGKKSKKEKKAKAAKDAADVAPNMQPNMAFNGQPTPVAAQPTPVPAQPAVDQMAGMPAMPAAPVPVSNTPEAAMPVQQQAIPGVDPMLGAVPVATGQAAQNPMAIPSVVSNPGVPEIAGMTAMPAVQNASQAVQQPVQQQAMPGMAGQPMIYGGANPAQAVATQSAPVAGQPYGGVDPMAAAGMAAQPAPVANQGVVPVSNMPPQ